MMEFWYAAASAGPYTQTICTSIHTYNDTNTSSLHFYRSDALLTPHRQCQSKGCSLIKQVCNSRAAKQRREYTYTRGFPSRCRSTAVRWKTPGTAEVDRPAWRRRSGGLDVPTWAASGRWSSGVPGDCTWRWRRSRRQRHAVCTRRHSTGCVDQPRPSSPRPPWSCSDHRQYTA